MTKIRCYSELRRLESFDERFDYLNLQGVVGETTFGFDRWINQKFYTSREWRSIRHEVILRDNGCDLGVADYEIHTDLLIHHMNPVSKDELLNGIDVALDPEFLITTSKRTHNAIHYGNTNLLPKVVLTREPGDTRLW
jgi:hypothetical protein